MRVSGKNIRKFYKEQSATIQVIQEQGTIAADISKAPRALPLKWLTDKPAWVVQWPSTTEKLQALKHLVQQQLNAQHIKESTSPWDSPVFIVKKKPGKWRKVTDLRAVNRVIQSKSYLQSSIPSPSLLPKG